MLYSLFLLPLASQPVPVCVVAILGWNHTGRVDNDQKLFEYQPLISVSSGNLQGSDSEDSLGCRSRRRRMLGSEAINLQCTANVWSPSGPFWENVDCTLHENSYGLQAGTA